MISRLISVGNVVVDIVATVPALPEQGGDVVATGSGLAAGGSFNVLAAARRQGLASGYAGAHGKGLFGDLVRDALDSEGVAVLLPPDDTEDSGWDVALTDASGERTFVTVVGAEARLTSAMLASIDITPADAIHVSGYGLLRDPNRAAIVRWLAGLPGSCVVVFDPGPLGRAIEADVLAAVRTRAHWWSGNEAEARAETGLGDSSEAGRMLATGASHPSQGIVVRLGNSGCLLALPDGSVERIPGFEVPVVDTNGAGDAHIGAFIAALAQGAAPAAAARRANAAAAIAVSRRGPATSPTAAELEVFLAAHPLS